MASLKELKKWKGQGIADTHEGEIPERWRSRVNAPSEMESAYVCSWAHLDDEDTGLWNSYGDGGRGIAIVAIPSAKNSFDSINTGIVQGSAKFILLDRALVRYGPEAKAAREQLKGVVASGIGMMWPTEKNGVSTLTAFERANGIELVQDKLRGLTPQNDAQREALTQAQHIANDLGQSRWLLIEEAQNQLPVPLLVILVFWLVLLFVSFGLFAPRNLTASTVLFVSACAISGAVFLVLELNHPLDGFIKVSSAPVRNALRHLEQ